MKARVKCYNKLTCRLEKQTMAKNLSFSYSKMGMYKECPQKYKFRYVHLLPEKPKYYFAFGTALHAVMEFIFNPSRPNFPTLDETLRFLTANGAKLTLNKKATPTRKKNWKDLPKDAAFWKCITPKTKRLLFIRYR